MEVRLIHKGRRSYTVALRALKDGQGQPLAKIEEKPFGPAMSDSAHVQERVERAQRAIACPSSSASRYDFEETDLNNLPLDPCSFSDTTICITITGPDCDDWSFIDLPGE